MHYLYFWNIISAIFDAIVRPVFDWVLKEILEPVIRTVGELLGEVLGALYESVLEPILEEVAVFALKFIWNALNSIFTELFFDIEIWVLKIVDAFSSVFEILMGVKEITVGGTTDAMINILLGNKEVLTLVSTMGAVAMGVVSMFSLWASAKNQYDDKDDDLNKNARLAKNIAKSNVLLMSGPAFVTLIVTLSLSLASTTSNIFTDGTLNYVNSGKITYGSAIFVSTIFKDDGSDVFKGGTKASYLTMEPGKRYTDDKEEFYKEVKRDFGEDVNIATCLLGIVVGVLMLVSLLKISYALVARLFDIIVLFVIFPFFAVSIPLDNGERYKRWRDMIIARVFIANVTFLMFLMTRSIFLPWIISLSIDMGNLIANYLLKIVLVIVSVKCVCNFSQMAQGLFSYEAASIDTGNIQTAGSAISTTVNYGKQSYSMVKSAFMKLRNTSAKGG